jgi:hypothetical protein
MNDLESLIQQIKLARQPNTPSSDEPDNTYEPKREVERKTYSRAQMQVKEIAVAYVVHNADGSFTQLQMRKTQVTQVWTTVIAETEKAKNSVTDLRLARLDEWEDQSRRKRNVYARGVVVQPKQCLCRFLKANPIENPVLLVVWEHPVHLGNDKICCARKKWSIVLFTNGTDTTKCKGGPVILVHTASGTAQLDEEGITTIASSAFIEWLQNKVQTEKWEVISLNAVAASVRVKGAAAA